VVVHLYGIPVDLPAVSELARSVGAVVIEDAAQATGATIGGKPAGSLGTYAVLSFGRGKGMTGGRGGALLGPSDALRSLPALIRPSSSWRDAALLLAQWALARPSIYGLPLSIPSLRLGETIYCKPKPAGSPSRFALGALTQTLRLTAAEAHHRRANAAWLLDQLPPRATAVSPIVPEGCVAGYLRLPVVVQPIDMERFGTDRARTLGVWPGYPRALSDLEGFGARRRNPDEPTPGARVLARGLFTLPTHRLLCSKDRITLGRLLHSVAAIPQSRPDASA
jgi:dTDP-4-amino-4,6-dideoxygalactose transaminase